MAIKTLTPILRLWIGLKILIFFSTILKKLNFQWRFTPWRWFNTWNLLIIFLTLLLTVSWKSFRNMKKQVLAFQLLILIFWVIFHCFFRSLKFLSQLKSLRDQFVKVCLDIFIENTNWDCVEKGHKSLFSK